MLHLRSLIPSSGYIVPVLLRRKVRLRAFVTCPPLPRRKETGISLNVSVAGHSKTTNNKGCTECWVWALDLVQIYNSSLRWLWPSEGQAAKCSFRCYLWHPWTFDQHHTVFTVSNQYINTSSVNKVCHFGLLSISEYSHLNIVSISNVTWNENFLINHMFKFYQLIEIFIMARLKCCRR